MHFIYPAASATPFSDVHTSRYDSAAAIQREIFIDNLLVGIYLIIEIILVDRPCAEGVGSVEPLKACTECVERVKRVRRECAKSVLRFF